MMISGDAAMGLAVLFFYLAMMLWGVFQTFWPSEPRINRPGGGRRTRQYVLSLVFERHQQPHHHDDGP
jgi:hypothetical protein